MNNYTYQVFENETRVQRQARIIMELEAQLKEAEEVFDRGAYLLFTFRMKLKEYRAKHGKGE